MPNGTADIPAGTSASGSTEGSRPISIRDAADIVPAFNGRNIPVYQFAKSCFKAKNIISPNAEYGLVQLIKNKFYGQASRVVQNGDYDTIEELIAVIKSRFAPLFTSMQLCGDMARMVQAPTEAVVDYGSRVSGLLIQIKSCNEMEFPDQVERYNQSSETNTVRAFLTGLKQEVYSRMRNQNFDSLEDAISAAILAEAESIENLTKVKLSQGFITAEQCNNCYGYGHNTSVCCSQRFQRQSTSRAHWPAKYCQHCQRSGHTLETCWFKDQQGRPGVPQDFAQPNQAHKNQPMPRQNRNWTQNRAPICEFCQNIGHTIQECRKKAYQERVKSQRLQQTPQVQQVRKKANLYLNLGEINKSPSVELSSENFKNQKALFMVDTGSIYTTGYIKVKILETESIFHIIEELPIEQDGILGTEYFKSSGASINYAKSILIVNNNIIPFKQPAVVIPSRTKTMIPIKVSNTEIKTGFVPKLQLHPQLYMGNAVVTNRDGIAFLYAINVGAEDIEIEMPAVELQQYEEAPQDEDAVHQEPERAQKILKILQTDHLNQEEFANVEDIVKEHADRFYIDGDKLPATNKIYHRIITTDEMPVNVKQYRYPHALKDEINHQVNDLLEKGIIKHSSSPFNSPLWIVPKKQDSKGNKLWRLVIDFRKLNEKTISDAYPLPNITDILDQVGSAKYFSVFDLKSSFHQTPMHPEDKHKTAFSTPFGHFEFNRMPFGLKNAAATFQRLMNNVLDGLQGLELFVFIDDIVVYASSLQEHETKVNRMMAKLREANLCLQPDKCQFLKKEVAYLGHIITEDGVKPDPAKVEAVQRFPIPKTVKNIRQFLGLCGYYRRFIKDFSKIAKPLSDLMKKEQKFEWSSQQQQAFEFLRNVLCEEPILQYPDFERPFNITTDASGTAVGAVLSQGEIGKDQPVAYASRVMNKPETQYSATERELLAVIFAVNHFRPYIFGRKFYLITDHKPLIWLNSLTDPTSRLMRWKLRLSEYDYEIKYKPGKQNINADALSRNPIEDINALQIHAKRLHSSTSGSKKKRKKKKEWHQYPTRPRQTTTTSESGKHKKRKEWHQYPTRPRQTTTTSESREFKKKKESHQYPTRLRPTTTTESEEHKKKKEWHQYPRRPRPTTSSSSRDIKKRKISHKHLTRPRDDSSEFETRKKYRKDRIRERSFSQEDNAAKKRVIEDYTSSDGSQYYETDVSEEPPKPRKRTNLNPKIYSSEEIRKKRRPNEQQVIVEVHQPPQDRKYIIPQKRPINKEPVIIGDEIEEYNEETIIPKHIFREPPKIDSSSSTRGRSPKKPKTIYG
uniref:uncharacterized protein LOC117611373 n=1 Tax=Osmia lignaria TaxID=473952 RepID=UPI00147966BB|nr:uncharacterized protein LOC117611373 [Osmia lignaria]